MAAIESHLLRCFAPIPAGHEVLVATVHPLRSSEDCTFALDQTTQVLYSDDRLFRFFRDDQEAVRDPLRCLRLAGCTVVGVVIGHVTMAVTATGDDGGASAIRTVLTIEPATEPVERGPYR